MKRVYEKPQILFESFSLSTSIAGDCEEIVSNPSKGTCAVVGTGNIALFDSQVGAVCVFKPTDIGGVEDQWNGACYHVPTNDKSLFNS